MERCWMAVQQNRKMQTKICSRARSKKRMEAILLDSGPTSNSSLEHVRHDIPITFRAKNARHIVIAVQKFCFLQFVCRYFMLLRMQSPKLSHALPIFIFNHTFTHRYYLSFFFITILIAAVDKHRGSRSRILLCRVTFRAALKLVRLIQCSHCLVVMRGMGR